MAVLIAILGKSESQAGPGGSGSESRRVICYTRKGFASRVIMSHKDEWGMTKGEIKVLDLIGKSTTETSHCQSCRCRADNDLVDV